MGPLSKFIRAVGQALAKQPSLDSAETQPFKQRPKLNRVTQRLAVPTWEQPTALPQHVAVPQLPIYLAPMPHALPLPPPTFLAEGSSLDDQPMAPEPYDDDTIDDALFTDGEPHSLRF